MVSVLFVYTLKYANLYELIVANAVVVHEIPIYADNWSKRPQVCVRCVDKTTVCLPSAVDEFLKCALNDVSVCVLCAPRLLLKQFGELSFYSISPTDLLGGFFLCGFLRKI